MRRFYLNQPGDGTLYLIFCWTFIALIEVVLLLLMSDRGFDHRYNMTTS